MKKSGCLHQSFIDPRGWLVLIAMGIASGCGKEPATQQRVEAYGATGTVRTASTNARELNAIASGARKALDDILPGLDAENPDSEMAKLNRLGGSARLPLSRTTFRALDLGRHYSGLTGGAYDFTAHTLTSLWRGGLPTPESLEEALTWSGMRFVEASDSGAVTLTAPGVSIYPGRLALAYAMDVGVTEIRRRTTGPFAVSFSGMTRQRGQFPGDEAIPIALTYLRRGAPHVVGHVSFNRPGAVTVQVHPSWRTDPGDMPLLIDPRTGRPSAKTRLAAVTGPLTIKAFALAEALLVLGPEEGAVALAEFPDYEALVVPDREPEEVWATPGFREYFTPANQAATVIEWVAK